MQRLLPWGVERLGGVYCFSRPVLESLRLSANGESQWHQSLGLLERLLCRDLEALGHKMINVRCIQNVCPLGKAWNHEGRKNQEHRETAKAAKTRKAKTANKGVWFYKDLIVNWGTGLSCVVFSGFLGFVVLLSWAFFYVFKL